MEDYDNRWNTLEPRHEEEDAREARWNSFLTDVLQFRETEGWDGVMNAVARAMREEKERG